MSPEKPKTPPEKFVAFNGVVYEIIPGSEDIPDTETTFGGRRDRAYHRSVGGIFKGLQGREGSCDDVGKSVVEAPRTP